MSRQSHSIKLIDKNTGDFVDAVIYRGISEKNIDDWQNFWIPQFESSRSKLKKSGVEDSHWDWNLKTTEIEGQLAYDSFAIEADEKTQGMMIINNATHFSKIEKSKPLMYIEYIATAPWNRKILVSDPEYGAVGKILFYQAIGESIIKKFEGRIGLHSLPLAFDWYKHLGMTDFGKDDIKKMHYLELDKKTALKLINEQKI